tara:strand:- start:8945 stop:9184 length:240 start_codon:yes stop_codon:yes gene_type:complete
MSRVDLTGTITEGIQTVFKFNKFFPKMPQTKAKELLDQISRMMEFLHTTKHELEYLIEGFTAEYEAFKQECSDRNIFDE